MTWDGNERRQGTGLSEEQVREVAREAAKQALELVYAEVGRSTVKFLLWVVGAAVLALLAYLGATGKLK